MKPILIAVLVAIAVLAAASLFLMTGKPSVGVQPQGGERKASEKGNTDERRAEHRAEVEARRREYEAYRKMSPEERRQFREKKREELVAHRRDGRGRGPAGKSEQEEREELRAAAIKARTEYEDSMRDEATGEMAANYRRRSVSYWMSRVKRQRERAAERGHRSQSENFGVDAGASAADSQKQKTKGKTE